MENPLKNWNRSELLALLSLVVAVLSLLAAIATPELRKLVGLDTSPPSDVSSQMANLIKNWGLRTLFAITLAMLLLRLKELYRDWDASIPAFLNLIVPPIVILLIWSVAQSITMIVVYGSIYALQHGLNYDFNWQEHPLSLQVVMHLPIFAGAIAVNIFLWREKY